MQTNLPGHPTLLYHASPFQGLTELVPRVGTHGRSWVYATDNLVFAALFLGRLGGDLTCRIGSLGGYPYVKEQFAGAFDLRYGKVGASLYVVPADGFLSGQTSWRGDWVSDRSVIPLREIVVADVRSHILELVAEGKLNLHPYTSGTASDSELVERFVHLRQRFGDQILSHVASHYPHLLAQVTNAPTHFP